MTLVELLVAVALGTILIGVITFVWIQSQRVYTETLDRLDIYENMRTVLDVMERDLANTSRTVSMEFWNDANGNGRYDPGEEIASLRQVRAGDPVLKSGEKEFFSTGSGFDLNSQPYFFAPTLYSPSPYVRKETGDAHWRDEAYVRSFIMVNGFNRSSLVHYRLCNTGPGAGRPSLRRRVWYPDASGQVTAQTDITSVLADGVVDLKIGFFFKPSPTSGSGQWYHVRPGGTGGETAEAAKLIADEEATGVSSAPPQPNNRFVPALAPSLIASGVSKVSPALQGQFGGANALSFFYEGWGKLELLESGGVRFRSITDNPPRPGAYPWRGNEFNNFGFEGIRAGDKIYIFDAQDDDGKLAPDPTDPTRTVDQILDPVTGQPQGEAGARNRVFPDSVFTVADVISENQKYVSLRLAEYIDFYRLQKNWLGLASLEADTGTGAPIVCDGTQNSYGLPGLVRTIKASFNARYRIGFLPSALLVRVGYEDRRHKRVVPVERVVRLLSE